MQVIREFFDYISNPYFSEGKDRFTIRTWAIIGKLLAWKLGIIVIAYLLISLILNSTGTVKPSQRFDHMDNITPRLFIIIAQNKIS